MLITRGDGLVSGQQAAQIVHVSASTWRSWVFRGHVKAVGLDEHNRPLYDPDDAAATEKAVRANGLRTSGIDPRRLRMRQAA